MISNDVIDKIIEVSNCYEVIKDFIELKKSGTNWVGLSPFSDEKTPSFTVSSAKNIWKDFSSGKGGHAITYLMQAQRMNFPEALKYLGNKYNIEIIENSKRSSFDLQNQSDKKARYSALEFSKNHYYNNLIKSNKVITYIKSRGFTPQIVKNFQLGYSLNTWTDLLDNAVKNKHNQEDLKDVNLVTVSKRKYFDKFRNRLMFPISDSQNRVIGYGARTLTDNKKEPKYINSSETNLYKKSFVLYGLNLAIEEIIRQDICYITEGYTDVISFHQSNVKNTVASCGTSLTIDQLKKIKRYTDNIGIIFDGDTAGIKAAYKSIDIALEVGFNVSVLKLTDMDPDNLAKSVKDLGKYINKNLMDFVDYKISFINHSKIDLKAKHINNIIKSVTLIDDSVKRKLYSNKITKIFNLDKADFNKIAETQKNTFKPSLNKSNLFTQDYLNSLNEICKNSTDVSINGISVLNYVILKIQELEDPYLKGFTIDYNSNDNLIINKDKELVLIDEIDTIFDYIKLDYIENKLTNITNEDLNFIQDLIFIKQQICL
jgi:DNA primase